MGYKKLQRRTKLRTKMVVPVRLFVSDRTDLQNTFLAHTLDASSFGARLGGFHGQLSLGQIVTVQYQHRRASFRVIWIGTRGSAQSTQLGIECLDPAKDIWNLEKNADSDSEYVSESSFPGRPRWSFNGSY